MVLMPLQRALTEGCALEALDSHLGWQFSQVAIFEYLRISYCAHNAVW
jgi:hypothetical protein